jgi:hypothetical protein
VVQVNNKNHNLKILKLKIKLSWVHLFLIFDEVVLGGTTQ